MSPLQEVINPILSSNELRLFVKRDDLIHPHISGNKWRKLKYNILDALQQNHHTILTFGGAFSNHIAATAFAAKKAGLESVGVIRGEDDSENPTLKFARQNGMKLHFVSRHDYRKKTEASFLKDLEQQFDRHYLVPEGGANGLGVKGCTEILTEVNENVDFVCCACGTATTAAGIALTLEESQKLLCFPVLKNGRFLQEEMNNMIQESRLRPLSNMDVEFINDYHFGGYAKLKPSLLTFISKFEKENNILLDPVYTGKMMFGIFDLIQAGYFSKGTSILAIHTGGLQGWEGMKYRNLV